MRGSPSSLIIFSELSRPLECRLGIFSELSRPFECRLGIFSELSRPFECRFETDVSIELSLLSALLLERLVARCVDSNLLGTRGVIKSGGEVRESELSVRRVPVVTRFLLDSELEWSLLEVNVTRPRDSVPLALEFALFKLVN